MAGPWSHTNNRIDELWRDHQELVIHLQSENQLRLISRVEESFTKTLLIAVASHFEVQLTNTIYDMYLEMTQGADVLAQFVRKQAIGRRFGQLFQWGDETKSSQNANYFYALFGPDFKAYMQRRVQDNRSLDDSVKAFLEIGNLRNQMVHGDYAEFQLSKTVDEVYLLYQSATNFVHTFPIVVREFMIESGPQENS